MELRKLQPTDEWSEEWVGKEEEPLYLAVTSNLYQPAPPLIIILLNLKKEENFTGDK